MSTARLEERVAFLSGCIVERELERYKLDSARLPEKKKHGAWMRARYYLSEGAWDEGERFCERFITEQAGFAYWCWYAAVSIELRKLLIENDRSKKENRA